MCIPWTGLFDRRCACASARYRSIGKGANHRTGFLIFMRPPSLPTETKAEEGGLRRDGGAAMKLRCAHPPIEISWYRPQLSPVAVVAILKGRCRGCGARRQGDLRLLS
jgi:hypothetical protein